MGFSSTHIAVPRSGKNETGGESREFYLFEGLGKNSQEGFVAEVSESSLCVEWEEYGICWYPINLIAATERIAAVAARPGSPKLFSA